MLSQERIVVPQCSFRVRVHCGRAVVERMLGENADTMAACAVAHHDLLRAASRLLCAAQLRAEVLKTGPVCPMLKRRLCRAIPLTPRYDDDRRLLAAGHFVVLSYQRTAWNQIEVLKRFQAENWPSRVEVVLAGRQNANYAAQLKETVFRLNRQQLARLVRFRCQAIERTVTWEWAYERFF